MSFTYTPANRAPKRREMSSFCVSLALFTALVLLLVEISAASSQPPAYSPTYPPKKKTSPVYSPTYPPKKSTPPVVLVPVSSPPSMVPDIEAPGPSATDAGTDCMTLLFGAADCLTYVEEGSNLTAPEKACCPELAKLVNTNPICLCQLLKKGNSFGIAIDMSRALALPSACKVGTPDPSLCALVNGGPTGAPGSSPTDGMSPTEAGLAPTSVNNDRGTAIIGCSTSSVYVTLVAVGAFAWNMY